MFLLRSQIKAEKSLISNYMIKVMAHHTGSIWSATSHQKYNVDSDNFTVWVIFVFLHLDLEVWLKRYIVSRISKLGLATLLYNCKVLVNCTSWMKKQM